MPEIGETCGQIVELQSRRKFCIKQQQRCDRSIESFLARAEGYHSGLPQAERKRIFARAAKLRRAVEAGAADADAILVLASAASRSTWDQLREGAEKEMTALARALPVQDFVAGVKGFGHLGLAVIVGETGDLDNYANPAKLWKRCGLAVLEGKRQGNPGPSGSDEDRKAAWTQHGYNPSRRAQIWAFCDDVMFRAQWRGDRDEDGKDPKKSGKPVAVPAHPIGPYGEVYAERKAWMLARGLEPAHADKEARRYMTKRLLRNLWQAWRGGEEAKISVEPDPRVPPAADTREPLPNPPPP